MTLFLFFASASVVVFGWTFRWLLHDFRMTFKWLLHDCYMTFRCFYMLLGRFVNDFCMTCKWLLEDLYMTCRWHLRDVYMFFGWLSDEFTSIFKDQKHTKHIASTYQIHSKRIHTAIQKRTQNIFMYTYVHRSVCLWPTGTYVKYMRYFK